MFGDKCIRALYRSSLNHKLSIERINRDAHAYFFTSPVKLFTTEAG